jgi:hypothetical protein
MAGSRARSRAWKFGANAGERSSAASLQRQDLPIGHLVRLTLSSGPFLEGNLFLFEEDLWLERQRPDNLRLRIGKVDFLAAEVESCVRLD